MNELLENTWQNHQKGSITVNKALIKELGFDAALLFGEILSRYRYFHNKGQLEDGYFYNSINDLESGTGIPRRRQQRIVKELKEEGLIDVYKGKDYIRRFKVNLAKVNEMMSRLSEPEAHQEGQSEQGGESETHYHVPNGQGGEREAHYPAPIDLAGQHESTYPASTNRPTNNYNNNYKNKREYEPTKVSKEKTDPGTKECISLYKQLFKKHVNEDPHINTKDKGILDKLVRERGGGKVQELLKRYFSTADEFIKKNGYTISLFNSNINSLLAQRPGSSSRGSDYVIAERERIKKEAGL